MKDITTYKNQKILVLGLAKSGVSAAKLLHQLGAFVTVNDAKPFEENSEAQELLALGIKVVTGSHPIELLEEGFVKIVKNPGIPYTNPILEKAIEKKIPIITEVELAYQISEAPFIGITGTNGKTTTTTMIAEIINHGSEKKKAKLAGNIGFPASTVAQNAAGEEILVTELSSFQLMGIQTFRPKIAVITNIYEAHLDYHGSRAAYVEAKWRLQKNMTEEDTLVLNGNQPELVTLSKQTKARVLFFSTTKELTEGACLKSGSLYYGSEKIMDASELGVPGEHNVENALAAIIVAKLEGCQNEDIKQSLAHFSGVPHRTQYLGVYAGRKFYNDSKATNILATEKALSGFENEKVILLAGGLDRGNNFDALVPFIKGIKAIILFGETKEKVAEAAKKAGISTILFTEDVTSALPLAFAQSQNEDSILLSPACASWDQYPSFEVRGEKFIEAFQKIKEVRE